MSAFTIIILHYLKRGDENCEFYFELYLWNLLHLKLHSAIDVLSIPCRGNYIFPFKFFSDLVSFYNGTDLELILLGIKGYLFQMPKQYGLLLLTVKWIYQYILLFWKVDTFCEIKDDPFLLY